MKYKSLSHSLSSLSFTLIPVIHTLPVRLSPPIPLSLFLSCLPSFTPPAQGTGDLQITTLSMLSASHGRKAPLIQARTHTHTHSQACSVTLAVPVWAHPAGFSLFVSHLMREVELGLGSSVGSRSGRAESWVSSRLPSVVSPGDISAKFWRTRNNVIK